MDKTEKKSNLVENLFFDKNLYCSLFNDLEECRVFTNGTKIVDCNLAVLSLFEYPEKSEIVDQDITCLFSPGGKNNQDTSATKFLISEIASKRQTSGIFNCIKANRDIFEAQVSICTIENTNGRLLLFSIKPTIQKITPDQEEYLTGSFLQSLLDSFQQPVFIKNRQFIYLNCNNAFANYLGKRKEDIIGANVFQIVDEVLAQVYHRADIELFESGENISYETKIRRNDGQERDAIFRKTAILNSKDEKIGIIGIIEDITEYKRFRADLADNERKYQLIFENVQDIYCRTDADGIITDISPSIKRYSEYVPSDIIGQSIEKFYNNPDDRIQLIDEIKKRGEVNDFEILLKSKNGEPIWTSINAHFTYDKLGQVNGLEGTLRDLSERKQAEDKLKQSLSLLQATLDSTNEAIISIDRNGKITGYNELFKKMFFQASDALFPDDEAQITAEILRHTKDPEKCVSQIKYLYDHPEERSFDIMELNDGRKLERSSAPQRLDGKPIGRVWNFRDITENERAGQQLRLMAHTLKSVNEAVSITDTQNKILFVNAAFTKTYGYSEEELVSENISKVRLQESDEDVSREIADSTLKNGWQGEILNRRKDGTIFPISLSTSAVYNENGEILAMVGIATDITERKRIELKLKESEERYRTFFEGSPDAIILADAETGIIVDANEAASRLLKRPLSEIIGQHHTLIHPKESEHFSRANFRTKTNKKNDNQKITENEVQCSDGSTIPVEILASTICINERKVLQGVFRNITERKNAEKLLQESEERYRTLFESMPDGVYRSTSEGKFVQVNQAMVDMLGYSSKEELMAIDIRKDLYFKPEDRDNLMLNLQPFDLDVYTLKRKDGTPVWVEDHGWYIRDENGKILFHEGITRDITERKQAELQLKKYSEELKELNATKDKFFSVIAHDLKNPFNSISGLSEIIKNEARHLDVALIEQYAQAINSAANSTFRLLENLLDWARIQQSKMPFNPVSLILDVVVRNVLDLLNEKAESKKIIIENRIPDKMIVIADRNMLETIFRNLLSNALKFTNPHGKIVLKAINKTSEIEISVSDSGMGIKAEDIQKIFRIDTNFSTRGTENEKGTGLGLLLCKEFVERHRGTIRVESEEGVGSTFTFTISQTIISQ